MHLLVQMVCAKTVRCLLRTAEEFCICDLKMILPTDEAALIQKAFLYHHKSQYCHDLHLLACCLYHVTHSPPCTPEHLGLSVLVGLFASGHRGPAQMAQTGAVLTMCVVLDAVKRCTMVSTIWCSFVWHMCLMPALCANESTDNKT